MTLEERELGEEAVKLQPAEKARFDLHAREERREPGRGTLDYAGEASLDIATLVIPGAVRPTIGGQLLDQVPGRRPCALAQERGQRHQPGDCLHARNVGWDVEGRVSGNFLLDLRVERQSEVEVQRLEIPGRAAVQGRDHEVSDDGQWRKTIAKPTRVDEGSRDLVRVVSRSEGTGDPSEPLGVQLLGEVVHRHILAQPHSTAAEGVGFEPTEACTSQLFKSCAFVRSAIPPRVTLTVPLPAAGTGVIPGPAPGPAPHRLFEDDLPQAHDLGRDLHALIIGNELEGVLE